MSFVIDEFVPGRLCILGEHTDWIGGSYRHLNRRIAKGFALVCTTSEGLYAKCSPYKEGYAKYSYASSSGNIEEFEFELAFDTLKQIGKSGSFFAYVAASILACMERAIADGFDSSIILKHGIEINNYKNTLPMKKGLSSSAAICVLVTNCFNKLFNSEVLVGSYNSYKPWARADVMDIAYIAESKYTNSKCGRMDQCVAMGKGSIGLMEFEDYYGVDESLSCTITSLYNHCPLYFVVGNVNGSKNTVEILSALNACFPFPQNSIQVSTLYICSINAPNVLIYIG